MTNMSDPNFHGEKTGIREVAYSTLVDQPQKGNISDISEDGITIIGSIAAKTGDCITLHLDGEEKAVGTIVEKGRTYFSVKHTLSLELSNNLKKNPSLISSHDTRRDLYEKRQFNRQILDEPSNVTVLGKSNETLSKIKDISETGIALIAETPPPIGEIVRLGFLFGIVYRHTPDGFVICIIAAKHAA